MTTARSVPPPCAAEPERWFDRSDQTAALSGCLSCALRRACAAQALASHATCGMWAGVWIEDNLAEMADLLRSVAADGPPPRVRTTPSPARSQTVRAAPETAAARSVLTVIAARSSGHCEAVTPACRLTFDTLGSRIWGQSGWDATSASQAYAVCRPCQETIASAEPEFRRRLGYIVEPTYDPAFTAFFWRQARWVYLDEGYRICPAPTEPLRMSSGG
jgi:hypothetical protein